MNKEWTARIREYVDALDSYLEFLEYLRRFNRNNYFFGGGYKDVGDPMVIGAIRIRNRVPASFVLGRITAE